MKTKNTNKSNFLNNQNYIFGKSEKKRVLSKFFVEKFFHDTLNILNFIGTSFLNNGFKYIYIAFFGLLIYLVISSYKFVSFTGFFTLFLGISGIIVISFFMKREKNRARTIKNIYSYFINDKVYKSSSKEYIGQKLINFFLCSTLVISVVVLFHKIIGNILITSSLGDLIGIFYFFGPIIILLTMYSKYRKTIMGFNLINLLLFPLVIIIQSISSLFLVLYIFILKGIKGYIFTKKIPNANIIEKFQKIRKNNAKNQYYEIKLK